MVRPYFSRTELLCYGLIKFHDAGEVPYDRLYDSPLPKTNVGTLHHSTPIYDLRPLVDAAAGLANGTNTETTGFQVISKEIGKTVMKEADWDHDEIIRSVYYDETIQ